MNLALSSSMDVFLFIIFCSFYVCTILWIYGDAATRNSGWPGLVLPLIFIIAGTLALLKGMYLVLLCWPAGYLFWFMLRPSPEPQN
jgi:hypothetical protein